jgi:CubicO group peptidase (beta-lactamase class C family)
MPLNRRGFRRRVAVGLAVATLAVLSGCRSADDRRRDFEQSLHPAPRMDVAHLFDYEPAKFGLEQRMRHYAVPGLAIAAISDGEIDWCQGYGVRSTESGAAVTTTTLFELGSATKLVTATLVMMLVEDGLLSLDAPVNDALVRWQIPENELTRQRPVTLRMLLSHDSGLNRPSSMFGFEAGSSPTLLDVLEGRPPAINDPAVVEQLPGSVHSYSNLAYDVIQLLIEDVTGRPFPAVMKQRVFDELGMGSCTYEFPFSQSILEQVAFPHDQDSRPQMNDLHPSALAHGGLLCTPCDLARLVVELIATFRGESARLMSAASFRQMLESRPVTGDEIGGFNGQGLGVFTLGDDNGLYFAHHGYNVPGSCCLVMASPSTGDGVVVMANGANGFDLIFEILAGLEDVYRWPEVRP